VQDEVNNGLSFLRLTLSLREIPKLYGDIERQLEKHFGERLDLPPFPARRQLDRR